jgi:glutathione S-transferase
VKLYHEVRGCSLAVDIVARELGEALAIEWVDMRRKTLSDGSDYHRVNSKGTVPLLLLPDGNRLSEGMVISQWLADQHPGHPILPPPGTMARYRVLEWMSFIAADLHKGGFMPLFKQTTPPEYRAIAAGYVASKLAWLDDQLADRTYLTGADFSIADAHCYTIAMWTAVHGIDTAGWPHLMAYLARIGARPSVRAAEAAAAEEGARQRAREGRPIP